MPLRRGAFALVMAGAGRLFVDKVVGGPLTRDLTRKYFRW
jgi:hypothetical protein